MRTGTTKRLPSLQDGRLTAPARMMSKSASLGASYTSSSGDFGSGARGDLTLQDFFQFGGADGGGGGGRLRPGALSGGSGGDLGKAFQNGVMATQTRWVFFFSSLLSLLSRRHATALIEL